MFAEADAVLLARIQFAFTISFHFIFPAFSIGLASYLVVLEALWLRTRRQVYLDLFRFWVKIFAVAFAMGVVSGIVMSYQFGTNWAVFSDRAGPVIGPLMAYEVMTAFFLEAGFLGVMLFGMDRVGPRLHFLATLMVGLGTLLSAFWILSANSWMHTPTGFSINDAGQFAPESWWEVIFNPSFPYRLFHTLIGAYLTTALAVGGVGGTRTGVKCLHAHWAWHLAGGDDPVGRWIEARLDAADAAPTPAGEHVVDLDGDTITVTLASGDRATMPWGPERLTARWLDGDPPAPESLTNALGAVDDHIDDLLREHPGFADVASLTFTGATITSLARIEVGREDVDEHVPLARIDADEIFRIVATETARDRAHNPGLPSVHVETIIATCCIVLAFMRRLHLDRITLVTSTE